MPLSQFDWSISLTTALTKTLTGLTTLSTSQLKGLALQLTPGVGAGQADRAYIQSHTLAGSANIDLDLTGVLLDVFGDACNFVKVKAIAVFADAGNTNNVVVGAAAATVFVGPFGGSTHTIAVKPGGVFSIVCGATESTGWAVGAGSTDLLRFTNSAGGTNVTFVVCLVGTSS
jgi:hypothetical protein